MTVRTMRNACARRGTAGALALAVLAALLWARGSHPVAAGEASESRETLAAPRPLLGWSGSVSCAAAACHNANTPGGPVGREYAIWAARDPHHNAYFVLYDRRSAGIEKNLHRDSGTKAWQDKSCLDCHVSPGLDVIDRAASSRQRADHIEKALFLNDGVGCESCHGASGRWRTEHYSEAWRALPDRRKQELGMQPTRDLVARARLCAGCHVGAPGREVDHDLVAAGHPRLSFEYGAFLGTMPKHWDEAAEKRMYPDLEARAWAIGQAVSAEAALKLLEHHASGHGPWPELAGYDCFACHHDLQGSSWRQRSPTSRPAGSPRWGDWYFSMIGKTAKDDRKLAVAVADLRIIMSRPDPDRARAVDGARELSGRLRRWLQENGTRGRGPASIDFDLKDLARQGAQRLDLHWDEAAQLYLALAAFYQAEGDIDQGRRDGQLRDILARMVAQLRFPSSALGTSRYDSPMERSRGDQQAQFQQALIDFGRRLGR